MYKAISGFPKITNSMTLEVNSYFIDQLFVKDRNTSFYNIV